MRLSNSRKAATFGGLVLIQYATMSRQTREAIKWQVECLQNDRPRFFAFLKKAALLHLVFWVLGSDQLGFLMNPKLKLGLGKLVARRLYAMIPATQRFAIALKIFEIASDEARSRMEIWMTLEYGYGVDAWATLITPEVWRCIEIPEKIMGVILKPERMFDDGMELTLQNIYGNLFRMLMVSAWHFRGDQLDTALDKLVYS